MFVVLKCYQGLNNLKLEEPIKFIIIQTYSHEFTLIATWDLCIRVEMIFHDHALLERECQIRLAT